MPSGTELTSRSVSANVSRDAGIDVLVPYECESADCGLKRK